MGTPDECFYIITNNVDTGNNTLTISSIVDTVHAKLGDSTSGNVLHLAKLDNFIPNTSTPTTAFCTGATMTGTGTDVDPWIGADICTIPHGADIEVQPYAHYSVVVDDYDLPGHDLPDSAILSWNNTCDNPLNLNNGTCVTTTKTSETGAQTNVTKRPTTVSTTIRDTGGQIVTTIEVGTTVHDRVHVDGVAGQPIPTGNVNIDWFDTLNCTGSVITNSGSVGPLDGSGNFDATGFPQTPTAAGHYGFLAHYEGDGLYAGSDGVCEPLTVVDANIQITPLTATNPVGTDHTLTGHVNINDGSASANAPDNTLITFSLLAGSAGSFNGPSTCLTGTGSGPTGPGTGSCSVKITSAATGTSTIRATTTVTVPPVTGISLTRTTGDLKVGDSADATKYWADDVVSTSVRDASNADVTNTTVTSGTVVHDVATVAKAAGTPAGVPDPTGSVVFTLYNNGTCDGAVLSTETVSLVAGSASSSPYTTSTAGTFSYFVHYNGDVNYPAHDETVPTCEPFTVSTPANANLTPGYWKTHQTQTQALLTPPLPLGNYSVSQFADAQKILSGMGCGKTGPIQCMAGMLLAAELNLANGGSTCIGSLASPFDPTTVIGQANLLLQSNGYAGFKSTGYPLVSAQDSATAMTLHDKLSAYNIDGVPTCI